MAESWQVTPQWFVSSAHSKHSEGQLSRAQFSWVLGQVMLGNAMEALGVLSRTCPHHSGLSGRQIPVVAGCQ